MNIFVAIIGLIIVAATLAGVVMPSLLRVLIEWLNITTALRVVSGLGRIAFGALLVYIAPESRMTVPLQIIGFLMAVAGVVVLFLPNRLIQLLLDWFKEMPHYMVRIASIFGMAFGAFLAFAALY